MKGFGLALCNASRHEQVSSSEGWGGGQLGKGVRGCREMVGVKGSKVAKLRGSMEIWVDLW